MIKIAPSILSADFSKLGEEIQRVTAAGADMIHIDIMDGHFVPNLTFGAPVVAAVRKTTHLTFDAHLMVENPQEYIEPCVKAGADIITIHTESTPHIHRVLQSIKEYGVQAGIALNPSTPLSAVEEVLADVDMILLMSVNPGFGGQKFIPSVLKKVSRLRQMLNELHLNTEIQVDGGINETTATQVISAGATILVAGSAVFGSDNMARTIESLRSI